METVLAAIIVVFVIIFGALSLFYASTASQETLHIAQSEMDLRRAEQLYTALQFVSARTVDNRTLVEITLRNTGSTRLADFDRWDIIVKVTDALTGASRIEYLAADTVSGTGADYETARTTLGASSWTAALFADAAAGITEFAEPGILNAGEELVIWARPTHVLEPGSVAEISIATEYGAGLFTSFEANQPPVLVNNSVMLGRTQESLTLDGTHLMATDANPQDQPAYTVTDDSMLSGTLSASTFAQADIDAGTITYSRSTEMDSTSFVFSVTDEKDTLTGQVFTITINEPPLYAPDETTVTLNDGDAVPVTCMNTLDPDDESQVVTFTLTAAPVSGTLNLAGSPLNAGASFTFADVISGSVTYQRTVSETDSFSFTVSDAYNASSPAYTVQILAPQG